LPPSAGEMNPKPLASLNHLTVPVAILIYLANDEKLMLDVFTKNLDPGDTLAWNF
jgi:hypothetical protein